jgi:ABC-type nickel/cobalt efflux system permease component RcnA
MLAAISLGQVLFGMLLIVAFSLGLAGVLTTIGLAVVAGRRISRRGRLPRLLAWAPAGRVVTVFPALSAACVTMIGLALTFQAWNRLAV